MITLKDFLIESNKIEGISTPPTGTQLKAAHDFLELEDITTADMSNFVQRFQPGAHLRQHHGMDVRVGYHTPPAGGTHMIAELISLLAEAKAVKVHSNNLIIEEMAYKVHHKYETLHPFMDGNGRSGRMLWLWMMGGHRWLDHTIYNFLHYWYYQSLQFNRTKGD